MSETISTLVTFLGHVGAIQSLIARGERTPEQIKELLAVLEAFQRGLPLPQALPAQVTNAEAAPDELQELLSSLADESFGFPVRVLYAFKGLGIRYVGEIYRINWAESQKQVDSMSQPSPYDKSLQSDIESHLVARGLPISLDSASCWRPPYWDDPAFRSSLNRAFVRRDDWGRLQFWYVGKYLRTDGGGMFGPCEMMTLEQLRMRSYGLPDGVWVAAFVPPDWDAPTDVPEVWENSFTYLAQYENRRIVFFRALEKGAMDLLLMTIAECRTPRDLLQPRQILELNERGLRLVGQILLHSEKDLMDAYHIRHRCAERVKRLLGSAVYGQLDISSEIVYNGPTRPLFERMLELRIEGRTKEEIVTQLRAEFPE